MLRAYATMYASHAEPDAKVWAEAVARRLRKPASEVSVIRWHMEDATKAGESFTSVLKRTRVEATVQG